MKIQKRKIKGHDREIVQVTTLDERWYQVDDEFYPSVTWIAGYYPKGIGFYKWLASKGWDEAESIKQDAGDKGSKVHQGIEKLLHGEAVRMDDKLINPTTTEEEEISVEEYEAIMSFADWFNQLEGDLNIKEIEKVVINEDEGYAGTLDLVLQVNDETWIVDFKTSSSVWPSHELQISAYAHCGYENAKLKILQVGYNRNKRGWKLNDIEDKYDLFLHAKAIWENENANEKPKQKDYPIELKLKGGDK